MAAKEIYLVPVDFSPGSDRALDYALKFGLEKKAKIIALHVVPTDVLYAPKRFDVSTLLERDARDMSDKLARSKRLGREDCTFVVAAAPISAKSLPIRQKSSAPR